MSLENWTLDISTVHPPNVKNDYIKEAKNYFRNFAGKPFRTHQRETIERILGSDKKVIVVQAPTGAGKSLIAACVIHELNRRNGETKNEQKSGGIYLCSTKTLQDQLEYYFPEFKILKGRSNYKCGANHDPEETIMADQCIGRYCQPDCPYHIAKTRTLSSQYRILNYSYFLTATNFVNIFTNIPTIICDEADRLEDILNNFISVKINEYQLKEFKIRLPKYKTGQSEHSIAEWKTWTEDVIKKLRYISQQIESEIVSLTEDVHDDGDFKNYILDNRVSDDRDTIIKVKNLRRKLDEIKSIIYKCTYFIKHVNSSWIQKREQGKFGRGEKITFEPLWLTPELIEDYFLRHVAEKNRKIVLMSATFPPVSVLAKTLGLSIQDMDYFEVPSTFDPAKRPIYLSIAGNLSYNTFNDSVQKICERIQEILNKHPNDKGIIHCVSFKLMNEIEDRVRDKRLMFHDSDDRDRKLKEFKESNKPLCFVSPSLERGVSLDDDLSRFIIIAKAPFLSLADKKVSARLYSSTTGNIWYRAAAAQTVIQMSGRATRSIDDYATVYILDEECKKLIFKNVSMFPAGFKDSIQLIGD